MNTNISKLLTIVIPVYKVEKYIRQCLDSVILPSNEMENLEIIIVNDGTPDNSGIIAHEYANKYPKTIKVIDKENGGHGSAWNVGLKLATGKYIRFLDSDDWLSNLSTFITLLRSIEADMIFTHLNLYYEQLNSTCLNTIKVENYNTLYNTSSFSFIETGNNSRIYNFWYCTYNTKMLQKEQPLFVEKVFYDDAILFIAPYLIGHSMIFLDFPLYNYRLGRPGQTVNPEVERKHSDDYLKICKKLVDFSNEHMNISKNIEEQRNTTLFSYMKNRCSLFSSLPYKYYKYNMNQLLQLMNRAPYIKKSPKMKFYQYTPSFISWGCYQIFNKFILPIINR